MNDFDGFYELNEFSYIYEEFWKCKFVFMK